jgi:D-alanine-D-alanine ligase
MRVLVLHTLLSDDANAADTDALVQARSVATSLRELGHEPIICPMPQLDHELGALLGEQEPDIIFNLVESMSGSDSLASIAIMRYMLHDVAFTGASAKQTNLTNEKVSLKHRLVELGLPTPRWFDPQGSAPTPAALVARYPGAFIVKPASTHASCGIDDASVIRADSPSTLRAAIQARNPSRSELSRYFAEEFIEGREFNLSICPAPTPDEPSGFEILPPAEILFEGYPADKPRIVGYAAKWEEGSFEFTHTPRRFEFPPEDASLIERLTTIARDCWNTLDMDGYGRIDFRVGADGQPMILEINTNPCLSPDAGFQAALRQAGISFTQAVQRILAEGLARHEGAAR